MNEQRFGKEIKGFLNQGLDLPGPQLARLQAARRRALEHQRVGGFSIVQWLPATVGRAGAVIGFGGNPATMLARWALPILLIAAALFGYQHWSSSHHPDEADSVADTMADIDSDLLKGDLPIKAYLDTGFREWLKGRE